MDPAMRGWMRFGGLLAALLVVLGVAGAAMSTSVAQAASGDPTVDCPVGAPADTFVKNYSGAVALRCGNSSKGYFHIARKHGWNSKMNLCIEATIANTPFESVNGEYGRHVRYFTSNQVLLEFRVFVDQTPGGAGLFGVVTAYNNSRDMGVGIPDFECGLG